MLSGQSVEFRQDRMVSFAHFLVGLAEIFPKGITFNGKLFSYRHGNLREDEMHVAVIRTFVQDLSRRQPNLREFELKFYGTALSESSVIAYYRRLLKEWNLPDDPHVRKSFLYLFTAFVTSFTGDPRVVGNTLAGIEANGAFPLFREHLRKLRVLFRIPENRHQIKIIPIPLYCRAEEIPTLKELGFQGIFGLNLDDLQIIEVPIVKGNQKITNMAVNHLLGTALHEICHFFYYQSDFFRDALGTKQVPEEDVRHLIAEGIACALGNGAFSESLETKDPQWYADHEINAYAHQIFPFFRDFLEPSKPLDTAIGKLLVNTARQHIARKNQLPSSPEGHVPLQGY
jgi:hypothetical protein